MSDEKICYHFRRTRKCPKEDISKMGEFPPGACGVPHQRSQRRYERRQDAHQAAGGSLWRKIGKYFLSNKNVREGCKI